MPDYITTRQYADLHGLPIETVRTRVKQKQIPFIKVGNSIMIDRSTPWEYRKEGRPSKDSIQQRSAVVSRKPKLRIKITRAYYVAVEDASGKELVSDFTFLTRDEAKKIGERMKKEVEGKANG